jgi:hypothetical protein
MIAMGINGNTYSRISFTSFRCDYLGRAGPESVSIGLKDFFDLHWDKARISRANEEMRSERVIRMIAVFKMVMLSSTGFKPKNLPALSPMDWKK